MKPAPSIRLAVTNDLTHDRRMDRICRTLAQAGYRVQLIGRKLPASAPFHSDVFESHRLTCWFRRGPLFYAEYNLRLWVYLLRHPADILCACDLDTAPAVRTAGLILRRKTVFDAHEYFTGVPELSHRPFVRRVWSWIARLTIPGFDLHYTVGEELARRMQAEYGRPFSVIRNIAPQPARKDDPPTMESRKQIILYQGAINVGRGLYTAVEAMTQLPEWQLWLAGQGDIDDELRRHAAHLGVHDRVRFLGWVAPPDLPGLLDQARINLNLRESGSLNDYYSLPNKFFDGLQAGLPSIHMDYPEYKAIVSQYPCAVLLPEVSVSAVVRAVKAIGEDATAWRAMSAASREASRVFTWDREAKRLLDLYGQL